MGCCASKEYTDADYHVGSKEINQSRKSTEKKENPHFKEDVAADDVVIDEFLKAKKRGSFVLQIFCCCGIFNSEGCCGSCMPDSCNCCDVCSQLAALHGHDPRELSHRNSWAVGFDEARKEVKTLRDCPFLPIVAIIKGYMFSPCLAKKMRLHALGVKGDVTCCGWCSCSGNDLQGYECCQGYQDRFVLKPGVQLKCCTDSCPEFCLNAEVCLLPGQSIDATMQYVMDTRDVKPDPQFAKFNWYIHELENLKKLVHHIGDSTPGTCALSEPLSRAIGIYANCLKRSEIAALAHQVEKQVEHEGGYWPDMKGRHLGVNTATKMAHRVVQKKSYVVKVPEKFYKKDMRAAPLSCEYPEQLKMPA